MKVFDAGTKLRSMMVEGPGSSRDVALDRDGNVYVTDTHGYRVLVFRSDGSLLTTIETKSWKNEYVSPTGVCVDNEGQVFVTEKSPCVRVFGF